MQSFATNGGDRSCILVHTRGGECGDREDVNVANDEFKPSEELPMPAALLNDEQFSVNAPNLKAKVAQGTQAERAKRAGRENENEERIDDFIASSLSDHF